VISTDGVIYVEYARQLASGNFDGLKDIHYFNLYPVFILAFQKVFSDWETSGRIVSVLFGTLSILPLYLLTRRLTNDRFGLVTSFLYAISPRVVEYSSDVLREPLFWFFFFSGLYLAVTAFMEKKFLLLLLASLFQILALLTRLEGILAPFILVSWIIYRRMKGHVEKRYFGHFLALYLLSLATFSIFFLFLMKSITTEWQFGQLGERIRHMELKIALPKTVFREELKSMVAVSGLTSRFVDLATEHRYVLYLSELTYKSFKSMGPIFFGLFVIGILKNRNSLKDGRDFFIIWVAFSAVGSYINLLSHIYFTTRHGLIISIPLFLWVSKGLFELASILAERINSKPAIRPFFFSPAKIIMILVLLFTLPFNFETLRADKLELKYAGLYLKNNNFSGKKIATIPRLTRVVFYADGHPISLVELRDPFVVRKELEEKGSPYLLLDEESKRLMEEKGDLIRAGFEQIEVPGFERLKAYSLFLYRLSPAHP
jgi:4-amino-4-deoxy-L-arabinose transferase-like glycosyltransferase